MVSIAAPAPALAPAAAPAGELLMCGNAECGGTFSAEPDMAQAKCPFCNTLHDVELVSAESLASSGKNLLKSTFGAKVPVAGKSKFIQVDTNEYSVKDFVYSF